MTHGGEILHGVESQRPFAMSTGDSLGQRKVDGKWKSLDPATRPDVPCMNESTVAGVTSIV